MFYYIMNKKKCKICGTINEKSHTNCYMCGCDITGALKNSVKRTSRMGNVKTVDMTYQSRH